MIPTPADGSIDLNVPEVVIVCGPATIQGVIIAKCLTFLRFCFDTLSHFLLFFLHTPEPMQMADSAHA